MEIKSPFQILQKKITIADTPNFRDKHLPEILSAMEEYAEQFKYDYSRECKCNDSPGSTWCCNLCGLPITPKRDKDKKILEWMDINLSVQSKLGASTEVIKQLLSVRSFFENYPK